MVYPDQRYSQNLSPRKQYRQQNNLSPWLDSDYLNKILGNHSQVMIINYYPSCPNPDLTLGAAGHSDASAITVLMQSDVSGLQVLKNGKWAAVEPIPNAFVVNLGDQLQVRKKNQIHIFFPLLRI